MDSVHSDGLSCRRWTRLCLGVLLAANASAGQPGPAAASVPDDASATEEPFRGITANGQPVYGLYPIETSGVSAAPVTAAAAAFLEALPRDQQERARLPVDDPGWRRWDPHGQDASRRGIDLGGIREAARQAARGLLEASLSAAGLELAGGIMRLGRPPGDRAAADEAGYRLSVFGEPSASAPWGWQLEGRDLVINYFVQGDQVVMSPVFLGLPDAGGRAAALQEEGAAMFSSLSEAQRRMAALESTDSGIVAGVSGDNAVLENVGIPASLMDSEQRSRLLALAGRYVGMLRDGHAAVKMAEVEAHLDDTYFAAHDGNGTSYYRVFSPVILIEFERQAVDGEPAHIHTILRTPNGNDYGKALLDQHLAEHPHEAEN